MIKVLSMMKRKEGMSIEDFRKWAMEEHPQIGKQFPKIRQYKVNVVLPEHADAPYDAVNELTFDNYEDFIAALKSEFGDQALPDILAHCSENRFRMVTEEKVII